MGRDRGGATVSAPTVPPPAPVAPPTPPAPTPAADHTGPPLLTHGWALLLLVVAAAHLAGAWVGWWPLLVLPAAGVIAYVVTSLAFRIGVPGWLAASSVLTLSGLAAELVSAPADDQFGAAVRDAVPRLLTSPRPAPATPEQLVPGVLLVVFAAVWVAVRQRRRGGASIAPVVAALVLYLAAALLSAGTADPRGVLAAVLAAIAALGWLRIGRATATDAGTTSTITTARTPRHVGRPAALLAVVIGTAILVAALVPTEGAYEPREQLEPPRELLEEPSPLPRLAAWAQEGDIPLLSVATERPLPLRLVALVDFDGATWRTPVAYRPFGVDSRDPLGEARRVDTVDVEVEIQELDTPWVPTPGRAIETTLDMVYVDDPSMTVATPDRVLAGERYALRAEVDDARGDDVRDAAVGRGAGVAPYVALPDLPIDLAELSRTIIQGASTPFEQALLIENAVRDGRQLDSTAPAGSSYARLRTFLLGTDEPGAGAGTSEQFATAFAVLARANGLPTRVVVGFQPDRRDADGRWLIRGRDALAWPEVHFDGWGWVRFAPSPDTPDAGLDHDVREEVLADLRRDQVDDAVDVPEDDDEPDGIEDPDEPSSSAAGAPDTASANDTDWPIVVGGSAVAVVLVLPLGIVVARRRRRWRHRRAGARGAWSEVLDLLVLAGAQPPRALPAPEVASELARRWPVTDTPHPAVTIADAADRDAFGASPGREDVTPALRHLRRLARRHIPVRRRAWWPFDPRPLFSARRNAPPTDHVRRS